MKGFGVVLTAQVTKLIFLLAFTAPNFGKLNGPDS